MARTPLAIQVPASSTKGLYTPLCLGAPLPYILSWLYSAFDLTLSWSHRREVCIVSGWYNGLCVGYSASSARRRALATIETHVEGPGDQERPRVPCIIIGDYASSALSSSSQDFLYTSYGFNSSRVWSVKEHVSSICRQFQISDNPLFYVCIRRP